MSEEREWPMWQSPPIESIDSAQMERQRAESFRGAALIGYGALLASNADGRFQLVLDAMGAVLWPQPFIVRDWPPKP
jgi:hypothetical protein